MARGQAMSHAARIAVVALVTAVGLSACAALSEEERCKSSGGAWRQPENRCEAASG